MKRTFAFSLAAAVTAVALSACTGGTPAPSGVVTVTATPGAPSAEPTATAAAPAPVVTPTPAASTPDYDFGRLYSMHVGDPFSSVAGRSDVTVAPIAACPWLADATVPGEDPNLDFSWMSDSFDPSGPTYVIEMYGDVSATSTFAAPLNAEGIGIGSSMSDVLAAYPDATTITNTDTGYGTVTQVRVDDPSSDRRYYFWAYGPTQPVFRIDLGSFPTEGYWPNGYDCAD